MLELLDDLDRWAGAGRRVVVARVVDIEGSGPRLPGAAMAVDDNGEVAGSVSGGCVEGAVVTEALDMLEHDAPPRTTTFGYSDDEAFAVGLTCGGTVRLFLAVTDPSSPVLAALRTAAADRRPVSLLTVVDGPDAGAMALASPHEPTVGSLGDSDLDRVAARDALGELAAGRNAVRHYGPHGEARADDVTIFVESFAPPPRMVIFGAVDFTAALARAGKLLGYEVVVCDARPVFATTRRFPMADQVVVDWPDRYLRSVATSARPLGPADAVCVLTHDHKFDVPAIVEALASDVGYLGAMGSRRTHAERLDRLREAGVADDQLDRLLAPIGLDLGARTPEETAVAVCAEIIARRTGRPARSLRETSGPIH